MPAAHVCEQTSFVSFGLHDVVTFRLFPEIGSTVTLSYMDVAQDAQWTEQDALQGSCAGSAKR
ncbi:hypothetical protein EMIT047CA2_100075 [Pseudomonas soli]